MRVVFEVSNYKIACTKCKSLLEFEFTDVYYRSEEPYTGCIKCPVCGCTIAVLSGKGKSFFLADDVAPVIAARNETANN